MKKILLLSGLLIGSFFIMKPANAQFHVSVNIGVQPEWGPVGYDYAEYYYLPDIEAYYCVPTRQFVYYDGGNWNYSSSLPSRCGNYDLYSGYKVVINERNPWNHFNDHRVRYSPFRYRHDQVMIRNSRGYGGGNYGRSNYEDRNSGRDNDRYSRRDNDNRRGRDFDNHNNDQARGWGRNNDRNNNNDRNYNNGREQNRDGNHDNGNGHGRGRW